MTKEKAPGRRLFPRLLAERAALLLNLFATVMCCGLAAHESIGLKGCFILVPVYAAAAALAGWNLVSLTGREPAVWSPARIATANRTDTLE